MAICSALTGAISKSCDTNTGGVRKIWLADYAQLGLTITSGQVTGLTPDPTNVVTTTATINNNLVAGAYIATTVVVSGDQTAKLSVGETFKYTYNTQFGSSVWVGPVLTATYNSGPNTTTIQPNYTTAFAPVLGLAVNGAAPNNTGNQTLSTYLFFQFEFNRNTSSFEEAVSVNLENGSTFFDQKVNLMLARRESTKREAIQSLVAGQKQLIAIVLDSNGLYWILGNDSGLYATEITGGSGVAKSDKNGYAIVLTAQEAYQAYEVTSSAIAPYLV
jgi:hypothetical protein